MVPLSQLKIKASEYLLDLRRDLWKAPAAATAQNSVWYAGLVIEPAEFSQQLNNLETSLRRANAPVPEKTPQAVPVTLTGV